MITIYQQYSHFKKDNTVHLNCVIIEVLNTQEGRVSCREWQQFVVPMVQGCVLCAECVDFAAEYGDFEDMDTMVQGLELSDIHIHELNCDLVT